MGALRMKKNLSDRPHLDQPAIVHDGHSIGEGRNHPEIVGDKKVAVTKALL